MLPLTKIAKIDPKINFPKSFIYMRSFREVMTKIPIVNIKFLAKDVFPNFSH